MASQEESDFGTEEAQTKRASKGQKERSDRKGPDRTPPTPRIAERATLAGYASERIEADSPDLMDTEAEANAFARFAVSKEVVPPLSIAVFGEWGSGKTFFMTKMQKHVGEVAALARDTGTSPYHGNVVQIEFNAWHYIESNLWASLVQHIFDSLDQWLRKPEHGGPEVVDELFAELATVKAMKQEAEERRQEASRAVQEAARSLQASRKTYNQAVIEHSKIGLEDVWQAVTQAFQTQLDANDGALRTELDEATATLGITDLKDSARDLHAALESARSIPERGRLVLSSILTGRGSSVRYWVLAALLLVVPGVTALVLPALLGMAAPNTTLLGGSAALATLAGWIGTLTSWASSALGKLENVDAAIQETLDEKTRAHREKVAKAENYLESLRRTVKERDEQVERAQLRLEQIQRDLVEASPRGHLNRFIRDRIASGKYEQHLGIIATIRKDFETLTQLMGAVQNEEADRRFAAQNIDLEKIRKFERIILYIDDLDRCPAERVVDVLQAVHLLLAFELFVVVVGVDSRWVSRSLQERYPHLLSQNVVLPAGRTGGAGPTRHASSSNVALAASSRDYLEKIFQVPFWVRPMDEDSSRAFARKLVEPGAPVGAVPPAPTPGSSPEHFLLEAEQMSLTEDEKEAIERLGPFLGRSPRRVKRFVNVYRIVKSGLATGKPLAPWEKPLLDANGEVVRSDCLLVQLAMTTGAPTLSTVYADCLRAAEEGETVSELLQRFEQIPGVTESSDWPAARGALEWLADSADDTETVDGLLLWLQRSMRFSFTPPMHELG